LCWISRLIPWQSFDRSRSDISGAASSIRRRANEPTSECSTWNDLCLNGLKFRGLTGPHVLWAQCGVDHCRPFLRQDCGARFRERQGVGLEAASSVFLLLAAPRLAYERSDRWSRRFGRRVRRRLRWRQTPVVGRFHAAAWGLQ